MNPAHDTRTHQRATGVLRVETKAAVGITALADLRQEGCLKARFPRPAAWMESILINSSGGIAGGDALDISLAAGAGTETTFAAQAAERFYRALPASPPATVRTRITVGAGAACEWLPQEAILFDNAALDRRLDIALAATSCFTGVEMLVFGRTAMGEHVAKARLSDTIHITRDGKPILHDAIRIAGPVADILARTAVAAGGCAVATIIHAAPDAATRLAALRCALAPFDAGASTWNNLLVARITAADGAFLRRAVVAGLETLRDLRPLPRVWNC